MMRGRVLLGLEPGSLLRNIALPFHAARFLVIGQLLKLR